MIFTHKDILETTRTAVNSSVSLGRLPCSVLITGGSASLREKCAMELASVVLCSEKKDGFPCKKCVNCVMAEKQIHPDITKIIPEEGKKQLSIKVLRDVCLSKLYISPIQADCKVFVIPDCDELSPVIQNALLKSIEEPPENTMFILCADGREGLLNTVISRLTEYHLCDSLSSKSKSKDDEIFAIAESIALAVANEDEFSLMLATAPMIKNRKLMAKVASKIILILRDAMAQSSDIPAFSGSERAAYALSRNFRTSSLLQIKDIMDEIIRHADANANENLLITQFSSKLAVVMKNRI